MLSITLGEIIVWVVIGALAGSLVGAAVKRSKKGFGLGINTVLGMAGAVVGGLIFKVLNIQLEGLEVLQFTFVDLLAAVIGSGLVLLVVWYIKRRQDKGG
ncbi:MAG: GlsB/YeaQ/YmgE family stress response membrane protein [Aggregatilineales bacterium]